MCIQTYLKSRQVPFEPLLHAPASTATHRAHSVHAPGKQVAKGVLVKAGESFVLAVLPATARVDFHRLSLVLDGQNATLATENQIEMIFGDCQVGAVPPFGSLYGLRTLVDSSLAEDSEIICAGNQRHECYRLKFQDYEAIEGPIRAHFSISESVAEISRTRQAS